MQTNNGIANVIQGITEVTPLWSRVESLDTHDTRAAKPYLWDMRIATSSIPRQLAEPKSCSSKSIRRTRISD